MVPAGSELLSFSRLSIDSVADNMICSVRMILTVLEAVELWINRGFHVLTIIHVNDSWRMEPHLFPVAPETLSSQRVQSMHSRS